MTASGDLTGLVLAGGDSRRMGEDKGRVPIAGRTQVERCVELLAPLCGEVRVSVRESQAGLEPYSRLPLVVDDGSLRGPAAGLVGAWQRMPDRALLVLAVDLPLADRALLECLIGRRSPDRLATAYVHPDGTIEPLCAIWEPRAAPMLDAARRSGSVSLRQLLESGDIVRVRPERPDQLVSANTPEALRKALEALGGAP